MVKTFIHLVTGPFQHSGGIFRTSHHPLLVLPRQIPYAHRVHAIRTTLGNIGSLDGIIRTHIAVVEQVGLFEHAIRERTARQADQFPIAFFAEGDFKTASRNFATGFHGLGMQHVRHELSIRIAMLEPFHAERRGIRSGNSDKAFRAFEAIRQHTWRDKNGICQRNRIIL